MIFDYLDNVSFDWPWIFWLALIVPVMIFWYIKRSSAVQAGLKVSSSKRFSGLSSWKNILRHVPFALRMLCLLLLLVAMARPHVRNDRQLYEGEGIDIVLCIDISGSMMAEDFLPNRMEAAKKVAEQFVSQRPNDKIGGVIFCW